MIKFPLTGRASGSPIVDLFITLLSMGVSGYKKLVKQRKELKFYLEEKMKEVANKHNLQVIETKNNPISIGEILINLYFIQDILSWFLINL